MKNIFAGFIVLSLVAACAFSPPGQNVNVPQATASGYGDYPSDYKNIVSAYLKDNPPKDRIDPASISFINAPDKYIYRSFSRSGDLYGYRVCMQGTTSNITKKSNQLHFFLINNNRVVKHSSMTGLATFFDRQCSIGPQPPVAAQPAVPAQAQAAPAVPQGRAADARPGASAAQAPPVVVPAPSAASIPLAAPRAGQALKYVVCEMAGGSEMVITMDQANGVLRHEVDGELLGTLRIDRVSDTSIVAKDETSRLFLSRLSGNMVYRKDGKKITGSCDSSEGARY